MPQSKACVRYGVSISYRINLKSDSRNPFKKQGNQKKGNQKQEASMGMLMRRYHRHKLQAALEVGENGIAMVFQAKLNENPGTPLPFNIQPNARASLIAVSMTALEDVLNATDAELTALPHITGKNVQALRDQVQAAITARDIPGGAHALPSIFPADNALTVAGYTTYESLADHTVKHLELIPGVAPKNLPSSAPAILEAYAAWVATQA